MKKSIITFSFLLAAICCHSQSAYLQVQDTRAVNDAPADFKNKLSIDFKQRNTIGVPGVNDYTALLTVSPWTDASGGKNHQLSFNDGGIFYRVGSHTSPTWEAWTKLVIEDASGNVGIGTVTPTEKLSVKGKIRAQEVKVEMANWPDFVFAKNYHLPSLQETEKHILANGHLPGIPSAAEVAKDGIELGEMNKKLLQKIEELTLYMIEMKKENDAQNKKLQTEIEGLKSKIK